uniref:Amino acid transporter transmembrane domain-containing protein n=1 Tax=Haptolina brevifila TaxID=156173 RepID=A0A7S2DI95_9EUKA
MAGVSLWPEDLSGMLKALPLIAFALQCHIQCAAVVTTLPHHIQSSPRRRGFMAFGATALTLALYLPAGISGFARYGDATNPDVLYNFDQADGAADVARICMAITALSAFPSQHFPARIVLHSTYNRIMGHDARGIISLPFALLEAAIWTACAFGVTAFAIINKIQLDLVFQLIGAIAGSSVILIIPAIIWFIAGPRAISTYLPAAALLVCGIIVMGAGTFVTLQEMSGGKS